MALRGRDYGYFVDCVTLALGVVSSDAPGDTIRPGQLSFTARARSHHSWLSSLIGVREQYLADDWRVYASCRDAGPCPLLGPNKGGATSLAGLRLLPKHARFVDAIHQLGAVLVTNVPQLVQILEALGRPAWIFIKHLLPFLERFLLPAELT